MFTTKGKVSALVEKSSNALSIFKKTSDQLVALNDEITKEENTLLEEIQIRESKLDVLSTTKKHNAGVVKKISDFLSSND